MSAERATGDAAPGQVLVDAEELARLRDAHDVYEIETQRLAQEMTRVQELLTELEAEQAGSEPPADTQPLAGPDASTSPPASTVATTQSPVERRPWWRAW